MTTKLINKAAIEHAKDQLGPDQFKHKKEAVQAISDDFKAGVAWAKQPRGVRN